MGQDDTSSTRFAEEIASLVKEHGRGSMKVGLDRCIQRLAIALQKAGCDAVDFQQDAHFARRIKTANELACVRLSLIGAETAMNSVHEGIRPGITEQQLLGKMFDSVIAGGGEFIETRLLSSGHRTNPWFQEAGAKQVRPGELIAMDTDTIGCFGYYADISRTFFCGPGRPSSNQKTLYQTAYDQIQHNLSIIKPGMTYREIGEKAWKIPDKYLALRYPVLMHGIGMHGEAPTIHHSVDFGRYGSDGIIEPGMVICAESYIGEEGGEEGVKLEESFIVTESGIDVISRYPFEEDLLLRQI
jgi:Xaa-Pro aminopeptidase